MPDIFNISTPNLINLKKFYKRAPRQFQHAVAGLLNTFAFGTRKAAIQKIGRNFVIRNPKFINSKVRVEKAKGFKSIRSQESVTGSITAPRFSGLVEQETGKKTSRTRTQTLFSRGNKFSNVMKGQARLKPNQNFLKPEDIKGAKNEHHRTIIFFRMLERRKKTQSFIFKKNRGNFKKGLYIFKGKKIKKLQSFDTSKAQPKKKPWLIPGREAFMKKLNLTKAWAKQLNFQLKRFK